MKNIQGITIAIGGGAGIGGDEENRTNYIVKLYSTIGSYSSGYVQ